MSISSDREVLSTCIEWLEKGHSVDLVTVVKTWGSSPKPPGSHAAVRDDGVLVGSVSGGCIEKQLAESFQHNQHTRVHSHHIDDEQARRYGLACGGQLELVFERLGKPAELQSILQQLDNRQRISRTITLGDTKPAIQPATDSDAFSFDGNAITKIYGPSWRVLLIGAGQLSRYVAEFAVATDFDVLVCEPRAEFRKAWQVADTQLIDLPPHEAVLQHAQDSRSAVLALTHDPNLDDEALLEALPSSCFYVGALGSTRNYEKRCKRLAPLLNPNDLDKLRSPTGLSIGSRTSAEIAISIVAELVQTRHKRRQKKTRPTIDRV